MTSVVVERSARVAVRVVAEIAIALLGTALVVWAISADQRWFDTHFLPAFFVSRGSYVAVQWLARLAATVIGCALIVIARPRLGRVVGRHPTQTFAATLAIVLAVAASELI